MPELPEVETIKNYLSPHLTGKKIINIEILSKKQFTGDPKKIINQKIIEMKRYGKIISILFSNNLYLNIHLKLTGELLYAKDKNNPIFQEIIPFTKTNRMPANTTRIILYFNDNSVVFFNDLRKFGWMKITDLPEKKKGIDVLSKEFTLKKFNQFVLTSSRPIKLLLMDQEKITGIGNIYANDSLFLSGIHPFKKSNRLSNKEVTRLYQSIKKIIEQAIKDKGSSGADEAFVLPDGSKGEHQRHFLVYQRENQPCPRCKEKIKRIKQSGRSSFYCPKCQKI